MNYTSIKKKIFWKYIASTKTGWLTNESVKMLPRKNRLETNVVQLIWYIKNSEDYVQ